MMPVFIVMSRRDNERWIDSLFISKDAAQDRCEQVKYLMGASGRTVVANNFWWSWVVETKLEDATLGTANEEQTAQSYSSRSLTK